MKDKNCGLAIFWGFFYNQLQITTLKHTKCPLLIFFHLLCHIFCGTSDKLKLIQCTASLHLRCLPGFHSLYCLLIPSHICFVFVYKFAWPFCLISFNLKVRHSAPSSSWMVHVLMWHLEKLDPLFFFVLVFNSWVVMHSGKCPYIPRCVVRCCSFRLVKHAVMLISYHFLFMFLVSFSLCMNGSFVRVPLIIDLQSHNTNKDPHF